MDFKLSEFFSCKLTSLTRQYPKGSKNWRTTSSANGYQRIIFWSKTIESWICCVKTTLWSKHWSKLTKKLEIRKDMWPLKMSLMRYMKTTQKESSILAGCWRTRCTSLSSLLQRDFGAGHLLNGQWTCARPAHWRRERQRKGHTSQLSWTIMRYGKGLWSSLLSHMRWGAVHR